MHSASLYRGLPHPQPKSLQTWDLRPPGSTLAPLLVTSGGHHWRPVQTCSLQDPPQQCTGQTYPRADTPWADTRRKHTPDGHCSGRYGSYRNAFLFDTVFSASYSEYLAPHKLNSLILYYVYLLVRDCNPAGPTFLFFSHDY